MKPTVDDLIHDWLENRGWPLFDGIRVGPARCWRRCRKLHAYAVSVLDEDGTLLRSWTYERPCDVHWEGK